MFGDTVIIFGFLLCLTWTFLRRLFLLFMEWAESVAFVPDVVMVSNIMDGEVFGSRIVM